MNALELMLAELYTEHGIDLLRLAAGESDDVAAMLDVLIPELERILRRLDLTAAAKRDIDAALKEARVLFATQYGAVADSMLTRLQDLARIEGQFAVESLGKVIGRRFKAISENRLSRAVANMVIQGAPSADWWSRQGAAAAFRFSQLVRAGFASGQTTDEIVRQVVGGKGQDPGILAVSKREARALVHTSIQTVANQSRMEVFQANSGDNGPVRGYRQISTLDSHTTVICMAYDMKTWDLEYRPVGHDLPYNTGCPRHFGCRSVIVPWLKTYRELGLDIDEIESTRASMDGQVSDRLDFGEWLKGKSQAFQDEKLGPGRADLWRRGVITLSDLLDLRGNPLTLEQLKAQAK